MNTRRAVAVAALFAVPVLLTGCVAGHPAETSHGATDADVVALLDERAQAVKSHEREAWLAGAADEAQRAQARVYAALQELPMTTWSYGPPELVSQLGGTARVKVPVHYRFAGDERDATVTETLDIVSAGGRWVVEAVSTTPTPPWEMESGEVVRGRYSLIVGSAPRAMLRRYAAAADHAVADVDSVWDGDWSRRLVVIVPASWADATQMLGASGDYAGYAALTGSLEAPGVAPGPVRILANQQVLGGLAEASRQAVLSHEAFHVATWGSGTVPRWLSEGLGDYVGYHGSDVPISQAVSGLLEAARSGTAPQSLPADSQFSGGRQASAAYEGAHLAVRMLVQRYGVKRVTTFYRAAASAAPEEFARVFQQAFRLSLNDFTTRWRSEISRLARARSS